MDGKRMNEAFGKLRELRAEYPEIRFLAYTENDPDGVAEHVFMSEDFDFDDHADDFHKFVRDSWEWEHFEDWIAEDVNDTWNELASEYVRRLREERAVDRNAV